MASDRMRTPFSDDPVLTGGSAGAETSSEMPGRSSLLEGLVPPLVHKLNNAIGGVAGLSDLIARSPGSSQAPAYAAAIGEQARLALDLLATLSDLTKPHSGGPEPVDLGELARRAEQFLAPLAEARATELEIRVPREASVVQAEPRGLLRELIEQAAAVLVPLERQGGSKRRGRITVECSPGRTRLRLALRAPAPIEPVPPSGCANSRSRGEWTRAIWEFPGVPAPFQNDLAGASSGDSISEVLPAPRATNGSDSSSSGFAAASRLASQPADSPAGAPGASASILLLESDPQLADLLETVLTEAGHRVQVAAGLDRVEGLARERGADLVLLESAADGLGSGPDPAFVGAIAQRLESSGHSVALLGSPSPTGWPNLDRPFRPGQLLEFVSGQLKARPVA